VRFCEIPAFQASGPPISGHPHQLAVARYANVYFGLAQAAEIDSIRAAIDACACGVEKDICVTALLIAATICTTGPHFAQPRQALGLHAYKDIIERRSRSVIWEFELALRRLSARPRLKRRFRRTSCIDWLTAVDLFSKDIGHARPAAVYFDPPYSKLQYSRYYHVLNVLIDYDYPPVSGKGRYPPLSQRFSSRFEFNAGIAKKEFVRAFEACRARDLHTLVSYSDTGFIAIEELAGLMRDVFRDVTVVSESIRHHSQGVRLGDSQGHVTEFVLIGHA
jgi:adenine-specific DNA-methyltransferase